MEEQELTLEDLTPEEREIWENLDQTLLEEKHAITLLAVAREAVAKNTSPTQIMDTYSKEEIDRLYQQELSIPEE